MADDPKDAENPTDSSSEQDLLPAEENGNEADDGARDGGDGNLEDAEVLSSQGDECVKAES